MPAYSQLANTQFDPSLCKQLSVSDSTRFAYNKRSVNNMDGRIFQRHPSTGSKPSLRVVDSRQEQHTLYCVYNQTLVQNPDIICGRSPYGSPRKAEAAQRRRRCTRTRAPRSSRARRMRRRTAAESGRAFPPARCAAAAAASPPWRPAAAPARRAARLRDSVARSLDCVASGAGPWASRARLRAERGGESGLVTQLGQRRCVLRIGAIAQARAHGGAEGRGESDGRADALVDGRSVG